MDGAVFLEQVRTHEHLLADTAFERLDTFEVTQIMFTTRGFRAERFIAFFTQEGFFTGMCQ